MNAFRPLSVNRMRAALALAVLAAAAAECAEPPPIRAKVLATSKVPDPVKAPYRDCLMRVRLRAEEPGGGLERGATFIAVAWAFRGRKLEPAASARVGDIVSLSPVPYTDLAEKLDSYMVVDETADEASPVFWVETWPGPSSNRAAPRPRPDPARPAPPEQTGDRIRGVLAAAAGLTLRPPRSPFVFEAKDYLAMDAGHGDDDLNLLELSKRASARNIEVLLIYIPPMGAVYPDLATNIYWDMAQHGRIDDGAGERLRVLGETDFQVLDLAPELIAGRFGGTGIDPANAAYDPARGSLSERGVAVAGKSIAERINARPWRGEARAGAGAAENPAAAIHVLGRLKPFIDGTEHMETLRGALANQTGLGVAISAQDLGRNEALETWLASPESEGARLAILPCGPGGEAGVGRHPDSTANEAQLRIIQAHQNTPFGGLGGNFVFRHTDMLTDPDCWNTRTSYWGGASEPPLRAIMDFRDRLAELKIELLMVFPPSAAALFPDYATNLPWDPAQPRVDAIVAQFAERLRAGGVNVIDLQPDFAAARAEAGPDGNSYPIYTPETNHWSPFGARLAARKIAEWIHAQPLGAELAKAHGSERYKVEEKTEIKSFGPLPADPLGGRPLGTPAWREVIHSVRRAEGSPAFDDPNNFRAPIQIIGDSFALYHGDDLASFYHHLVAETRLPIGVNAAPGGSTQAAVSRFRNMADKRATRLVIWEVQTAFLGAAAKWGGIDPLSVIDLTAKLQPVPNSPAVESIEIAGETRAGFVFNSAAAAGKAKTLDRLGWDQTRLGGHPVVKGWLAVAEPKSKSAGGVEFQVLVGGEIAARKTVAFAPGQAWIAWEADLAAHAHKNTRLELRAISIPARVLQEAYWAEAKLEDGFIN